MQWIESLIAAAVMTLGCVLLFVYLLNLPFQLWPQSNASGCCCSTSSRTSSRTIILRRPEDVNVPGLVVDLNLG